MKIDSTGPFNRCEKQISGVKIYCAFIYNGVYTILLFIDQLFTAIRKTSGEIVTEDWSKHLKTVFSSRLNSKTRSVLQLIGFSV